MFDSTEFDFHFKPLFCWKIETKLQAVLGFLKRDAEPCEIAAVWWFLNSKRRKSVWFEV